MPENVLTSGALSELKATAGTLGISLNDQQLNALDHYLALIEKWNRVYNLTSIRDSDQMLVQHVYDSLAVIAPMSRTLKQVDPAVIDVGSGAGLPGVVIAIAKPSAQVVCVDAVGKKASFIQQVASELRLINLSARHTRIEKLDNVSADLITARAFASLSDLVSLTQHLLKPDGVWMAMKGKQPDAEISALPSWVDMFHVEQLNIAALAADRCIVWMRRR